MATEGRYIIREAREKEQSTLVSFIERYFIPYEHIVNAYLKKNEHRIDETERKIIADDIRNTCKIIVSNVPCLVAVDSDSNKIAGLIVIFVEENPKFVKTMNTDHSTDVNLSPVTISTLPVQSKLLNEIIKNVLKVAYDTENLFTEFSPYRTVLRLSYLCVDSEHSGRGLATRLVQNAVIYAENRGIGFVYGFFSSPYSRKAAKKNDFRTFSEVDIFNLRDEDGNVIFEGEESHVVSVMAKQTQITNLN